MNERKAEAKLRNFTPLLDDLVKEYDVITAAVWGRVWRYAQQENNVCQASHEKIATELSLSTRTVIRKLKALTAGGYLKDHSLGLRNRPHTYSITDKARLIITIEGVTKSHTKGRKGVTESHTGMTESHSGYDRESHEETIKETIKDISKPSFISNLSAAADYYFDAFGRKKWANPKQRTIFADLEAEVGEEAIRKAVDWAATNDIARLSSIATTARKIAKQNGKKPNEVIITGKGVNL